MERGSGSLRVATLSLRLPCERTCPFNKECASMYKKGGTCRQTIDTFVATNVYGKPGEKEIGASVIRFDTTEPDGKVSIVTGIVGISR